MYLRCPKCAGATRLALGHRETKARCGHCGRHLSLAGIGDLGATPQDRFRAAEVIAESEKIDLASGYSVLLGLMSIEQALALRSKPKGGADRAHRDDRVSRASNLAQKHKIPMKLAFEVAEGRITMTEARGRIHESPNDALVVHRSSKGTLARIAPILGGVIVGGVVLFAADRLRIGSPATPPGAPEAPIDVPAPPAVAGTPEPQPPATVLHTTDDIVPQVTRIDARTPQAVLEAFCDDLRNGGWDALRIAQSRPHHPGVRVGFLHTKSDPGREYAIWIRRHPTDRGWFAGNGLEPLQPEPWVENPDRAR